MNEINCQCEAQNYHKKNEILSSRDYRLKISAMLQLSAYSNAEDRRPNHLHGVQRWYTERKSFVLLLVIFSLLLQFYHLFCHFSGTM